MSQAQTDRNIIARWGGFFNRFLERKEMEKINRAEKYIRGILVYFLEIKRSASECPNFLEIKKERFWAPHFFCKFLQFFRFKLGIQV